MATTEESKRTEEEEAGRIAKILGGLKKGVKNIATKENVVKAAQTTGEAAKAVGKGAAVAGQAVKQDWQRSKEGFAGDADRAKRAGKWTRAAGGAAAGWTASKVGGAKQAAANAKEKIAASFSANEINLFFLVCIAVFLTDFIFEFALTLPTRFIMYLALALWGAKFFEKPANIGTHLLIVYIVFALLSALANRFIPQQWVVAFPIFAAFYLVVFFYPGIRLGLTSFLISGIAFAAPLVPGIMEYYIAPLSFLHVTIGLATKFTIDLVATVLALSWIIYLTILADWKSVLGYKPIPLKIGAVLIFSLIILSTVPALANTSKATGTSSEQIFGTIESSAIAIKTTNIISKGSKTLYKGILNLPDTLGKKAKQGWTKYMNYATAGYYSENVEKQNVETWVVGVSEINANKEEYLPGDKVTVTAVFSGIRKEEKIQDITGVTKLDFGCRTKKKKDAAVAESKKEDVDPNSVFLINLLGGSETKTGKKTVTCSLDGLTESRTVEVYGSFGLSTKSDLLVLFTTAERKARLVNDPQIKQYALSPVAKPTGTGPVTIALEFEETYPIIAEPKEKTKLLITVEDHDEVYGRIQQLSDFKIGLPAGMKLGKCNVKEAKEIKEIPTKEDGTVDVSSLEYPIEDFASIKCDIVFSDAIKEAFSFQGEQKDVISKDISVSTSYKYEIAKGVNVNVKAPTSTSSGGTGTFAGDVNLSVTQITASEEQVSKYLEKNAGAKLKDQGKTFYSLGTKYGIDPAFAIAVSQKETSLGKATCAGISQDCNNFFCIKYNGKGTQDKPCTGSSGNPGPWAGYSSVERGIEDHFILIKENYVSNGQDTPAKITCAPGSGVTTHCYCEGCPTWAKEVANFRAAVSGSTGSIAVPSYSGKCANVIDYAREYLGTGYGGTELCTVEAAQAGRCTTQCGSFVTNVYRKFGIDAAGNGDRKCFRSNAIEIKKEDLQAGDIISLLDSEDGHAALYIANGKIIHSTSYVYAGSTPSIKEGVVISDLDKLIYKDGNLRAVKFCRLRECT